MIAGSSQASRRDPGGRPVRRTWRLLSGTFVVLTLITGAGALLGGDPRDWAALLVVAIGALAAIAHRNAVVDLEARGRAEAENFARILRGLSRSVSADAIVGAIVDDLAEGTGADHVVVVRRRSDGATLEATLVTRRAGVPTSSTFLPLGDLYGGTDGEHEPVAVPVVAEVRPPVIVGAGAAVDRSGDRSVDRSGDRDRRDALDRRDTGDRRDVQDRRDRSSNRSLDRSPDRREGLPRRAPQRPPQRAPQRSPESLLGTANRAAAWTAQLLTDLGLPNPNRGRGLTGGPLAEVVGDGFSAGVAVRIAERVRLVYGLSHTLAAPLRTDSDVIGAIVLSRRDREPWPGAARRLLEAAADEAAAALTRANSYREATANASTDPLTGLPNRRYFDEFCGLMARRRRSGDAVAVLMVDIDKFKVLNDTFGHPVGDEVLKAVAGAIVTAVREQDVPARVGGEEFAVLLRNPGPEVALEVGERVRAAVRALDLQDLRVPGVSVSVGVANALGTDEPISAIVERADRALYRAKRAGRDRVVAA